MSIIIFLLTSLSFYELTCEITSRIPCASFKFQTRIMWIRYREFVMKYCINDLIIYIYGVLFIIERENIFMMRIKGAKVIKHGRPLDGLRSVYLRVQ